MCCLKRTVLMFHLGNFSIPPWMKYIHHPRNHHYCSMTTNYKAPIELTDNWLLKFDFEYHRAQYLPYPSQCIGIPRPIRLVYRRHLPGSKDYN